MLQSEFEELSGCPAAEYEAANELYSVLPNLNKRDFCLLWSIYGADFKPFKAARRALELANGLHDIQKDFSTRPDSVEELAHGTLRDIEGQLRSFADDARAELLKPENWSRKAVAALRKMNA